MSGFLHQENQEIKPFGEKLCDSFPGLDTEADQELRATGGLPHRPADYRHDSRFFTIREKNGYKQKPSVQPSPSSS